MVDSLHLPRRGAQNELALVRERLRPLLGDVVLAPAGDHLIAEVWGDLRGLMALASTTAKARGFSGCGGRI